jgi:tetratricopeptide (TPR) repeat protein
VPAPAFAPGSPNPAAAATAPPAARAPQPTAEAAIVALLREGGEAQHQPAFRISRSHDAPRIHPDVARGYAALRRGDLAEALRSYEAAQAAEPLNVDVQLGLATIGARSGDRAAADRHYRRALEIDPRNSAALAGLASMADSRAAPDQLEAQLRSDAQRYPQSAALQMALGNLYASQGRWTEAQQVYFDAFRLDPESADASYNLAVSLDHLGQSRVARDYYQRSLAAAQSQAVQFDTTLVRRRVDALRP